MDDELQRIDLTGMKIRRNSETGQVGVTREIHRIRDILYRNSIELNGYAVIGGDPPRDPGGPGRRVERGGDREAELVKKVPHLLTPLMIRRSADPLRSGHAYGVGRDI
jgi:hypothetical protein